MLLAKPVIPDQYWILRDADRKVGNIEAGPDGVQIRINNQVERFKNIRTLKQRVKIDFEPPVKNKTVSPGNAVHGFETTGKPFNGIYDVKHQVPLWTKEPRSKSWYAAGWYRIKQGRHWEVTQCPKLITLERYPYQGPFHSESEAAAQ